MTIVNMKTITNKILIAELALSNFFSNSRV